MLDSIINIIHNSQRKFRNYSIAVCIIIMLGTMAVTFYTWGMPSIAPLNVLTSLMFCISIIFFFQCIQDCKAQQAAIVDLLKQQGGNISWVYYKMIEHFPFGIQMRKKTTLVIKLLNKVSTEVRMSETDIKEVMELMKLVYPQATFGHSKHKEQLYNISPDLLINEKKGSISYD